MQPITNKPKEIKVPSGNEPVFKTITNSKGHKISGFFKKCNKQYPEQLAELESGMSAYYQMVLGNRAAKVITIKDENGVITGSFSILIHNFESMDEVAPDTNTLIIYRIADLLVASYVREEDDLHPGNIGLKGRCDYDMSGYTIAFKIKGMRYVSGSLVPHPKKAFSIHRDDLRTFPILKYACPFYWPTKEIPFYMNRRREYTNIVDFKSLKDNPRFIKQKHLAFLKEILIDRHMLKRVFLHTVKNKTLSQELILHFSKRLDTFRSTLMDLPEFMTFFRKQQSALEECLEWYHKYNIQIANKNTSVNLDNIRSNYFSFWRASLYKEVITNLIPLHVFICKMKQNGQNVQDLSVFYKQFINAFITYYKKYNLTDSISLTFIEECKELLKSHENRIFKNQSQTNEWKLILENIWKSIQKYNRKNYINGQWILKSLTTIKKSQMRLKKSQFFSNNQKILDGFVVINGNKIQHEKILAHSLKNWLKNQKNKPKILKISNKVLDSYRPTGENSFIGYINPYCYTRKRTPEIKKLIKQLENTFPYPIVMKLFEKGKWEPSSYNTSLMVKLCKAMLKEAVSDFTFTHLLEGTGLIQVSHEIEKGIYKVDDNVKRIYQNIFQN